MDHRVAATVFLTLSVSAVAVQEPAFGGAIPVTAKRLSEVLIYPKWEAPASAVAINDTRLSAEIAGRVLSISVRVGDDVASGNLVAQLDCQDYEIAFSRAQAIHLAATAKQEFADARLKNAERLAKKRSIAEEELDQRTLDSRTAKAEVDRAATGLRGAKRDVEKCAIRAPFEGVVVERLANVGDYAVVGSPVVRLLDREHIEVSAKVQEQDIPSLRKSQDPVFAALARGYPVTMRAVIPVLESRIRSYEARFAFRDLKAPPGAAGRLTWTESDGFVPSHLLVRRGETLGVFVLRADRAAFVPIPNAKEGKPARADLPPHTEVVVEGRFALQDGDPVQAVVAE